MSAPWPTGGARRRELLGKAGGILIADAGLFMLMFAVLLAALEIFGPPKNELDWLGVAVVIIALIFLAVPSVLVGYFAATGSWLAQTLGALGGWLYGANIFGMLRQPAAGPDPSGTHSLFVAGSVGLTAAFLLGAVLLAATLLWRVLRR